MSTWQKESGLRAGRGRRSCAYPGENAVMRRGETLDVMSHKMRSCVVLRVIMPEAWWLAWKALWRQTVKDVRQGAL